MLDAMVRKILTSKVYEVARETPLERAPRLSGQLGHHVWFKREDLQPVFSFKLRGAYNLISHLPEEQLRHGVIAASAGNHAQGVAYSARKLGIRATIVMPETTPMIKVNAVKGFGAEVVLYGDNYSDAQAHCDRLAQEKGLPLIPPFDDPYVIAGQGTVGEELLRQSRGKLDAVFVPVGGGGLIAGIAAFLKSLLPDIRIYGVEPVEADAMYQSLLADRRVELERVGIFADGVAVRSVGEQTFAIVRQTVDAVIRVTNDEICAAIKDGFDDTRSIMEPAGALSIAGLKKFAQQRQGEAGLHLAAILSGANMNFDRLRFVAERAELGEEREALFAVTIPERPGSFRAFCTTIGARVITEFNYRLQSRECAQVFVGLAVNSREDAAETMDKLREQGYGVLDLSEQEVAKLHIRHMVGGLAPEAGREILYRFRFPERPGALMEFLDKLSSRWNISLFHYRNHGADWGRILAGFEVPKSDQEAFDCFLAQLGYPSVNESESPVYRAFLSARK